MADIPTVNCLANGPYIIEGPVQIADPKGNHVDIPEGKKAALCRCGQSERKPFCDGAHSKVGFSAEDPAPQ